MARIVLTWEMGGGYGHIARLASIAAPLAADGHELSFLLADLRFAARHLEGFDARWLPAPRHAGSGDGRRPLFSHAEIMKMLGFGDADGLFARLRAWQELYAMLDPDLLIHDHSATALLAARGRDIPQVCVGTGFVVPPQQTPFPNLRPWVEDKDEHIRTVENEVLANTRTAASRAGIPEPDSLQELYAVQRRVLTTYPDLDHYPGRTEPVDYWGVTPPPAAAGFDWPEGEGPQVFVYLKPFKTLVPFLDALRDSGARAVLHISGTGPALAERYAGSSLRFSETAVDMRQVAAEADLCVSNGGHATVATMLLAGVPMLVLPQHLEQLLTGRMLATLGAGTVAPRLRPEGMKGLLERMLAETSFREAARTFAEQHEATSEDAFENRVRELVKELV